MFPPHFSRPSYTPVNGSYPPGVNFLIQMVNFLIQINTWSYLMFKDCFSLALQYLYVLLQRVVYLLFW